MRKYLAFAAGVAMLAAAVTASETISYIYDAKGRVIKVERTGTVNNNVQAEYAYDRADSRTTVKITGSPNLPPP